MKKRYTRSGSAIFMTGCLTLLTACPPSTPNTVPSVKPIPSGVPVTVPSTPAGDSQIDLPPNNGSPSSPGASSPGASPTSNPNVPVGLNITESSLPNGVLQFDYNHTFQATGGSGAYRWSLFSGNLPPGLTLDQTTGLVFGRPTQTGTFSFEVQALDVQDSKAQRKQFFILVSDTANSNSLSVLTSSLPSGAVDQRFSQTLEVSGGTAPYTWSVNSGALPDGLSLNSNTGEISGTPTLQGEETFTVKVSDSRGQSNTKRLSLTINSTSSNIAILSGPLPLALLNDNYDGTRACGGTYATQLQATGGDNSFTWSVSEGSLPTGMSLSSNGTLSGTPTANGSFTFTARVQDGDDNAASKVFTMQVENMLVNSFTPESGSEGLQVTIQGEGFANPSVVAFPAVDTTTNSPTTVNTGNIVPAGAGCQTLTTNVPSPPNTNVKLANGGLTITGGGLTTVSERPFIAADVAISEIFTNPEAGANQFVELKNKAASSVSVAGWHLRYTDVDGGTADFTIPSDTPPLAPGEILTVNLNADGPNSNTRNIYTGTAVKRMRFAPIATTSTPLGAAGPIAAGVTEVALCTDSACSATTFRDYMEFGPAGGGAGFEATAVAAGIWTAGQSLDLTSLMGNLDETNILGAGAPGTSVAHNGTNDNTGNANRGLLLPNADATKFTGNEPVVVDSFSNVNVTKRTLVGKNGDRLLIDSVLLAKNVQATNTGTGLTNDGILVNDVNMLTSGDYLNVLASGIVRQVTGLPTGPKVELNARVSADIRNTNDDDGTGLNNPTGSVDGLQLAAGSATLLSGASSVSITVAEGQPSAFTVVRNVTGLDTATDRLKIDQPLATATVPDTNIGDGITQPVSVNTATGFINSNRVLFNNTLLTLANPGLFGNALLFTSAIATGAVNNTNTGTGDTGSPLRVSSVAGFADGNFARINGTEFEISKVIFFPTPGFEFAKPVLMTAADNGGDGTDAAHAIEVDQTDGFAVGSQVLVRGQQRNVTAITAAPGLVLDAPIISNTVNAANIGNGTSAFPLRLTSTAAFNVGDKIRFVTQDLVREITAKNDANNTVVLTTAITPSTTTTASAGANVTVGASANFKPGDTVYLTQTGDTRTIQTIANGTTVTLTVAPSAPITTGNMVAILTTGNVNLAPKAETFVLQNGNVNLVPKSGTFTLVPNVVVGADRISFIPKTGQVFYAPHKGTVKKYYSIKFDGLGNATGDFTATSAPTPGS